MATLENQLEAALRRIDELEKSTKKYKDAVDQANEATASLFALGSRQGAQTGGMTSAFKDASDALDKYGSAVKGLVGPFAGLASKLGPVGAAVGGFTSLLGAGTGAMVKLSNAAIKGMKVLAETFDGASQPIRSFDLEVFNLGKQFGSTIEEASKFADGLNTETASAFAQSLYITKDQMRDFMDATARTSLSLDQLNETVETGIGSTKLYSVAAAQAAAMGVSMSEAADYFNTAMNKQGKSAQEASEMIAGFSAIAEETGLRASTVASTLNGAVQGFEKLGMSADFGRPILEGFGNTMNDMGLGIENAVGLTQSLTKALADLTTNYANAYLVFQRGGLDIGGGGGSGVLGASIGMQAAMLEAEQTGDQANIGSQLAMGMKETLASFTGGDIVTVQQAAESPELQNQFYIQQQMLKNQFGVGDDQSATRVLDMLSRLDEATRSGDQDAKAELEKQLKNEMEGRDKTLDEWEKANQQLAIQSNLLAVMARPYVEGLRGVAAAGRRELTPLIQTGGEKFRGGVRSAGNLLMKGLDKIGLGEEHSSISQILTAPGPTPTLGTTGADLLTQQATMVGPPDNDLIVQATQTLVPALDGFNLNMNELPKQIEQASMLAASEASSSALEQAGFTSRRDLADALAMAMADAFSAKLKVEIDMTGRTGQHFNTVTSLSNDLSQGTRNRAGGGSPSPP
jgi:hypothetical protein